MVLGARKAIRAGRFGAWWLREARARKSVVGGILELVKNCDGFSAELGVRVAGGLGVATV